MQQNYCKKYWKCLMASCLMRTSWNPHLPESPWSAPHKNITAVQVRTSVCLLPHQNAENLFWILQKIHNKKDNKRRHEWKSIFELNLRLKWLIKQNYIIQVFWFLSSGQLIFHFLLFSSVLCFSYEENKLSIWGVPFFLLFHFNFSLYQQLRNVSD